MTNMIWGKVSQIASSLVQKEAPPNEVSSLKRKLAGLQEEFELMKEAYSRSVDQISLAQSLDFSASANQAYQSVLAQNEQLQQLIDIERAALVEEDNELKKEIMRERDLINKDQKELEKIKEEVYKREKILEFTETKEDLTKLAEENARIRVELERTQTLLASSNENNIEIKVTSIQKSLKDSQHKHSLHIQKIKQQTLTAFQSIKREIASLHKPQELDLMEFTTKNIENQLVKKLKTLYAENLQLKTQISQAKPSRVLEDTEKHRSQPQQREKTPLTLIEDPPQEEPEQLSPQEPQPVYRTFYQNSLKKSPSKPEKDELNLEELLGSTAPSFNQLQESLSKYKRS